MSRKNRYRLSVTVCAMVGFLFLFGLTQYHQPNKTTPKRYGIIQIKS